MSPQNSVLRAGHGQGLPNRKIVSIVYCIRVVLRIFFGIFCGIYDYICFFVILLCPACQKVDAKSAHASLYNSNGGYYLLMGFAKPAMPQNTSHDCC